MRHPLRWLAAAGTASLTIGLVTAYAAQASPTQSPSPSDAVLTQAYAAARHVPARAIGEIRAGTLHTGSYNGTNWATAEFQPATSDSTSLQTAFQDGASGAVFSQNAQGDWEVVDTGSYGCGYGLPSSLAQQWGITQPAVCTQSAQQAAAKQAPVTSGSTLGQKIANIALGQVGVQDTPSSQTFSLDCDPYSSLVGAQSPDADGCGLNTTFNVVAQNETWCSDFAKWVWQQAGITVDMNTVNAGADSFYTWATQQGQTPAADPTTLAVGDAIMFYPAGQANAGLYADHVGIVTAVNSDGTVNLVNGDFGGPGDPIKVEYDTDVDLAPWASAVWSAGEQWAVAVPPAGTQQPAPVTAISGPQQVVAGTSVSLSAFGVQPGGSMSQYLWTFGDGRNGNVAGQSVSHEWAEDGTYPVTVSATSSLGTVTTKVMDVNVTGPSSAVASATGNAIWFDPGPVDQYVFQRAAGGGLVADFTDSGSWLQLPVPGQPDSGSGLASLGYPDPDNDDAMTPHAFYTQGGTLTETSMDPSGWTSQALAGSPVAGSAIQASAEPAGPDVFYFGAGGKLSESADDDGTWTASALGGPATGTAGSLALADASTGPALFYLDSHNNLTVTAQVAGTWVSLPVISPYGVAKGTALTAVSAGPEDVDVFFIDGHGNLAEATQHGLVWSVRELPGSPAASTQLASTSYLVGSSQSTAGGSTTLGQEVYFLNGSGQPQVDYSTSADGTFQTASLPGTATGIAGADSFQVPGQPDSLYLTSSGQLSLDQASSPSGTWSPVSLPTAPSSWAQQIVLYAATPADQATAQAAAAAAGLPASDVITSFYDAWLDTMTSNEYLVISVGAAATDALYFNQCGWANPSDGGYATGSTPFNTYPGLLFDSVPGAANVGDYVEGLASDSSQQQALITDLAYYALHGTYPSGVTASTLPAQAWPSDTCSGSAG
jgi:hypothetical protein